MDPEQTPSDPEAAPPAGPHARPRPGVAVALIVLATALAYLPVMDASGVWDDRVLVWDNPLVQAPDGLYRLWFTTECPDYYPLTYSMFWAEYRLWGDWPPPYHWANIILHAGSAVLLWRVLERLRVPGALLAALIFAVHPVNVGSVAWIAERKNTLPMVFYLLTVLAWLRFEDRGRRGWYAASLVLFTLAMLAKTAVVMLPAVLLVLCWWRRGQIARRDVLRTLPFFAIAAAFALFNVWYQFRTPADLNDPLVMKTADVRPEGPASRLAASGWIVWFYLSKLFVPLNLAIIYPRWEVNGSDVLSYVPLVLLAACLAVLWLGRGRWGRGPATALAYFVVSLAPVLGLLAVPYMQHSLVFDHLEYFAMIGMATLVAATATVLATRLMSEPTARILAAGLVLLLLALTFHHAGHYRNAEALWTHQIALHDGPRTAFMNRGLARENQGRYREAAGDYSRAIEFRPDAEAYNNRGCAYWGDHRLDKALADFDEAIRRDPKNFLAYNNRAGVRLALRQLDEAISDCTKAIELSPPGPRRGEAHRNRAIAHLERGNYDAAWADVRDCREAQFPVAPAFLRDLERASGRRE